MAKTLYVPVNNLSSEVKKILVPVNGLSKYAVKGYCSVGGLSKLFFGEQEVECEWKNEENLPFTLSLNAGLATTFNNKLMIFDSMNVYIWDGATWTTQTNDYNVGSNYSSAVFNNSVWISGQRMLMRWDENTQPNAYPNSRIVSGLNNLIAFNNKLYVFSSHIRSSANYPYIESFNNGSFITEYSNLDDAYTAIVYNNLVYMFKGTQPNSSYFKTWDGTNFSAQTRMTTIGRGTNLIEYNGEIHHLNCMDTAGNQHYVFDGSTFKKIGSMPISDNYLSKVTVYKNRIHIFSGNSHWSYGPK